MEIQPIAFRLPEGMKMDDMQTVPLTLDIVNSTETDAQNPYKDRRERAQRKAEYCCQEWGFCSDFSRCLTGSLMCVIESLCNA